MIAAFLTEPNILHATYLVALKGLKVKNHGYCGAVANAADGVLQLPEWAFDGRGPVHIPGQQHPLAACPRCAQALKAISAAPPR